MPDSLAACDWSRSSKWRVWEDQNIFAIRLTRCACFVGARPPRASLTFRRTRPQEPPRNSRCTPRPSPTCPPPLSRVRHRKLRDARSPRAPRSSDNIHSLRRGDAHRRWCIAPRVSRACRRDDRPKYSRRPPLTFRRAAPAAKAGKKVTARSAAKCVPPPLSEDLRKSVGTSGRSPETSETFFLSSSAFRARPEEGAFFFDRRRSAFHGTTRFFALRRAL